MKSLVLAVTLATSSALAADVGVSVTIGQPGFYGQINIGSDLTPRLVLPQPVIIAPPPTTVMLAPIYLRVPPGHRHDWKHYCKQYGACGRQVYFVDDDWYEHVYVPHYKAHPGYGRADGHRDKHGKGHGDHGHGRGHDKD